MDGEIARFKNMQSISGFFLETLDVFIISFLFVGDTILTDISLKNAIILIIGLLDTSSILLYRLMTANSYSTLFSCGKDNRILNS